LQTRRAAGVATPLRVSGWVEGNLCAAIAVVLARHAVGGPAADWVVEDDAVALHWRRNGFGGEFGLTPRPDAYETAIPFRRFAQGETRAASAYLSEYFRPGTRGLPDMTERLLEQFRVQLLEVVQNASDHAEAEAGVYSCGQYFPHKHLMLYTIADTGIGFAERARRSLGERSAPEEAVSRALAGRSTKRGVVPGGCGLQIIREFARLNQGRLIVVSDAAYWEEGPDGVKVDRLQSPFPGTAVTLEVRTDDRCVYALSDELE